MAKQAELDERVMQFISADKEGISVDWQELAKLRRKIYQENDGSRSWQPLFENLLDYLAETGTLTLSPENSWTITGGGIDLSPKKPAPYPQLYFARRGDAESYSEAFYKHLYTTATIKPARETV